MKILSIIIILVFGLSQVNSQEEMTLLGTWSDSTLPPGSAYNNTYNEVWGFKVNGHEYGVIGSTMGTHILDITDPTAIFEREFIQGASAGPHIVHRDYHDFKGYLYAVSDESGGGTNSTLQIIDISGLPNDISVVYDDDDIIERTHNIFIDTTANKLYALAAKGGDSAYKAMKIYTLEDPIDPQKIGQYGVIGGEGFGHVHDAYIDNDTAFLNTGGDGLFIVDFAGDDPVLIDRFSTLDYPESGYNHSGWLSEDKEYYYFADETWGTSMKTVKMNGFQGIELSNNLYNAGNDSEFSIAHNQVVHCGKLYVSYYYDGLQVYDLDDPENPIREAYYPTSQIETRNNYEGAWGVYPFLPSGNIIVSDMQEGFFLLEGLETECSPLVGNKETELNESISVYPNPSQGTFQINSSSTINTVQLLDLQGRELVIKTNFEANTFQVNDHLLEGIYLLKINLEEGTVFKRVYIQN